MSEIKSQFPIVEANLLIPKDAKSRLGNIAICSNTQAAGQVESEIPENLRRHIAVYGSLIVSRGGAERMVLNSIVHPTFTDLVLFGEESRTFQPSSNLLQAIRFGFEPGIKGNYIKGNIAASGHYPNLSAHLLDLFRDNVRVLPVFTSPTPEGKKIIAEYIEWLKPSLSDELYQQLKQITSAKKIYYDALNDLVATLAGEAPAAKKVPKLNPLDFKHLQPPVRELEAADIEPPQVPFRVSSDGDQIRIDFKLHGKTYVIKDTDEFNLGFSLMQFLGENKAAFSPLEQLLMGAEVGRVSTELLSQESHAGFVVDSKLAGKVEVDLAPQTKLKPDAEYYYNVGVKNDDVSVACLAFDECAEVFELRASSAETLLHELARLNRFQDYEMDFLHRYDIGIQVARASIALNKGYIFAQDFKSIVRINTTTLPHVIVDGDSFGAVHQGVLRRAYTEGLTEAHGDAHKGTARSVSVLAIYRASAGSLDKLPQVYAQGDTSTEAMRTDYQQQLLRFDHDGNYSYGERTRSFFGYDQLEAAVEALKKNPTAAAVIQRFDPSVDMSLEPDPETGKLRSSHDPCLTHDIYFMFKGKLQCFHLARAHNLVNAYPENIFGLHDAYDVHIANELGVELGDMFMFSSRGNILLLTEDQRTKKLLAESVKPRDEAIDLSVGPFKVGASIKKPALGGIYYAQEPLKDTAKKPDDAFIAKIENYRGVDTLQRAIDYLDKRGGTHNNPMLTTYDARERDLQNPHLVFFQANVMGGKLYVTAVYANRQLSDFAHDRAACHYLASRYARQLKTPLGELVLYSVGASS